MPDIVEEVASPKSQWKTAIRRRLDGTFRVHLFRWLDEDVPDYGRVASAWVEVRTSVSITDDMATARSIADDLLRQHARDEYAELSQCDSESPIDEPSTTR